jgi:hypothetical protein
VAIDGIYNCEVKSMLGNMPVKMQLTTDGDILGGSCSTPMGDRAINGRLPAPDQIAFSTRVKGPLGEVTLEINAKINGNDITGQVNAGRYGKASFKGKKVQ